MDDVEKTFVDDLRREDDVGLVLRGHIHIEHQLIELISVYLPIPSRCDWGGISYRGKLSLAVACSLQEEVKTALEKLGTLRNGFAHTLSAAISKDSVLDIYNGLPSHVREGLKQSYTVIGKGELVNPSSLEPRDLLTLILLNLRQVLKAAVIKLRLKHGAGE